MKKVYLLLSIGWMLLSCQGGGGSADAVDVITISTEFGEMKAVLYDETPKHKARFLKLAKEGEYDQTIFHRVMDGFMVQGGDVDMKNGKQPELIPDPAQLIDAEIKKDIYHRKGALAAARQPDEMNPDKKSSWCQFYIAQGKVFTESELKNIEQQANMGKLRPLMQEVLRTREFPDVNALYDSLQKEGAFEEMNNRMFDYLEEMKIVSGKMPELIKFTEAQQALYTTKGGVPFLDGEYTVFGQVIDGLEVVDSIAKQPVDGMAKPETDIKMEVKVEKVSKKKLMEKYGAAFPELSKLK